MPGSSAFRRPGGDPDDFTARLPPGSPSGDPGMVVQPYVDPGYGMPNAFVGNLNQAPGQIVGGALRASDNPLAQAPSWADAYRGGAVANTVAAGVDRLGQWLAEQRAKSARMGLWDEARGMPTGAGLVSAAQQTGNALLMGTTAPGVRAFHGSLSDFERFDTSKLHPDEAGHWFGPEALARDYAGRSSRDPTAGHMYEVNIKADPEKFLDYGSLHPTDQAALNDPGAVQKLRDAGVPGIRFPDGTHVVFDANTIDILRKYGIAGLIAGGGAAAAGSQQQPPMAQ